MQCPRWIGIVLTLSLVFGPLLFAEIDSMKDRIPRIIELKDKGLIGEKLDGLLGAVKDSPEVKSIIKEENEDRLQVYKERAKSQNHELLTFMKVMGEERIKKEPPERFIETSPGSWVKKK